MAIWKHRLFVNFHQSCRNNCLYDKVKPGDALLATCNAETGNPVPEVQVNINFNIIIIIITGPRPAFDLIYHVGGLVVSTKTSKMYYVVYARPPYI